MMYPNLYNARPAGDGHLRPSAGRADMRVSIVDGPFDEAALSRVLARPPVSLGSGSCSLVPGTSCSHGTFIMGLLGARKDAELPGICADCELLHAPLFRDDEWTEASASELARAIRTVVAAGAKLINLSLAIVQNDAEYSLELADALDHAKANGAIVVAAAGNQGRMARGQILSHPVTIPVTAVDIVGELLPASNFGPSISRRGVAALGHNVAGYAPGGNITGMSGTSVATAIATGILAQAWVLRPEADGDEIRAAVARLRPRGGPVPPFITRGALLASLDQNTTPKIDPSRSGRVHDGISWVKLQGGRNMSDESTYYGRVQNPATGRATRTSLMVTRAANTGATRPSAQVAGDCACGGEPGSCTCNDELKFPSCANAGSSEWNYVYVLGTVDVCVPDSSITDELQRIGDALNIKQGQGTYNFKGTVYDVDPQEDVRSWCYRILADQTHGRELRYIARQLRWILKVEGLPAYYLCLTDSNDLSDLIELLSEPKPSQAAQATSGGTNPQAKPKAKPRWPYLGVDTGANDLSLFVGTSQMAPVESCPGVVAPILAVDYFCAFERELLASWIKTSSGHPPKPKALKPRAFSVSGGYHQDDFFRRLVQSTDNYGDTDEWRALNYLAVQYKDLYRCYADMLEDDYALDSITVRRSRLWGGKRIVDPVFAFRSKDGVIEKYYVRVDVTHRFPSLLSPLSEYFDR